MDKNEISEEILRKLNEVKFLERWVEEWSIHHKDSPQNERWIVDYEGRLRNLNEEISELEILKKAR